MDHVRYILSVLIYKTNKHMRRLTINTDYIWGKDIDPSFRLSELESKQDFVEWLENLLDRLIRTLSGYQKSNLFKKKTGETYKDYLINYRLNKAKTMLSESTMPIATISEKIGYDNEHCFSKVFKQKVGMTPSQFRKTV